MGDRLDIKTTPLVPFGVGFTAMLVVAGSSLTSVSLDWDEGASLSAATRSPSEIGLLAMHRDAVIAPYYLMLHVVVRIFGESDVALRLPSLLAMSLGVGVMAELGRRLNGQATGILAGIIGAAIPSLAFYANTARPYAFAFLFATLSSLLLLEAVRKPSWWRWAGYAVCVFMTGAFHLVALSVLAAHVVIWGVSWLKDRDHRLWRALPLVAAALVALAPLMWLGKRQRYLQIKWAQAPTWDTIATLPGDIVLSTPVGFLLLGLAVAAFSALPSRTYLELVALVAVPVAAIMAVSFVGPVWVARYGIFLIAPLVVLAAATITSEHVRAVAVPRLVRTAVVAGALVFLALPAQTWIRYHHNSADTRGLAAVIHDHAAAGDVVVYSDNSWSMRPNLTHYLGELEWERIPQPPDVLLDRPAARNGTLEATESLDLKGRLTGRRIWLVGPAAGVFDTPEDPLAMKGGKIYFLRQHYLVQQSWTRQYGRVALLVPFR
jgi:mannosyltransferase